MERAQIKSNERDNGNLQNVDIRSGMLSEVLAS